MPTEATEAYARRVPHVTEKGYMYAKKLSWLTAGIPGIKLVQTVVMFNQCH